MWSPARVVTPPIGDVLPLEQARAYLGFGDDVSDVEVLPLIDGAGAMLEKVTSTRLLAQTVELATDRWDDLERLPIGPVNAVESVSVEAKTGERLTIDAGQYELQAFGLEAAIVPTIGTSWPTSSGRRGAIVVRLVVGYGDQLPANLRLALFAILRARDEDREADIDALIVNDRIWI